MASVDLEYNQGFKIYNANGTRFNNLVLHKATYETVVMSLGDKISGIVYYKNNKLVVNMTEYIMYKGVKYVLVNPPTIIKEGLVSDNGELKGMTKYSFTFYHPMYMLSNFPFSDVAVDNSQKKYLSQNKTFSWIGNLTDYVVKLNKNLEGTQWKVSIGTNVTNAEKNKLSEVLSFDNNTIADALKTAYETWEIPYVIDQTYEGNKMFLVRFGLPNNEIYEKDKNGNFILDDNNQKIPFVFKYGQGVGLKNNSRTPKNNKIVTRIAGYGSEDNIPYGYPQIVWTGNQNWNYTINNDSTAANSYPIYDGIVGGQKVRLIKHPFTRTHLMPPIYRETVNKKVNPNATGYKPDIELVDYYDANGNTYPNQIKAGEPSYEIHEFEDIKPEFDSSDIPSGIYSATPYDGHSDESISQDKFLSIVDDLYTETDIKAEKTQLNALRTSFVTQQQNSATGTSGNYEYDWSFKTDGQYKKVKYASSGANFEYVVNVGLTPSTIDWDDTMDEQGNYVQSYFKVTIPALGFDLYASAAITQEMTINMRSGACIGCSFPVMVDWDDYKRNFYDNDGNFAPTGTQRNYTKYPNSTNNSITLILQKETNTFGTLMPNIYQKPASGDKFVILGISLPTSYITTAEGKLETEMKKYMRDNNVYYYEYPLKFDEHFLISNEHILSQMKPNVIVNFEYADVEQSLYIKQMSIKYNESPLPKYDITLTDDVDVVLNKIGEAIAEYRGQRQYENRGCNSETLDGNKFLRKDINDTASGTIRMLKGLQVGERFVTGLLGEGGIFRKDDDGTTYLECDRMYVRMKAYFDTVEVRRFLHSGGNRVASAAGIKCSRVEYYTQNNLTTTDASEAAYFRCYFRANDNGTEITNDFEINDLAYCKETNKVGEQANTTNAVATRSVSSNRSVSEENITISLVITNNSNASVTLDGEARLVLSNPDVDGTYHGWNGSYNRTDRIVFSNSAVTLAVGESRTVTLSGELYRRSPAGDNALAEAGSRSNVILYVGGVSEVVLCSKLSSSIVFQNGGTYNVSLSQGGQGISQRFYWRKVIGVSSAVTLDGEHYIDLSATDCATGSDVPIAQDDIIQLGNTIDATRQGAIIEFVSGEDAPSYQIYQGINTYNLDNKNYIGLGYSSQTGHAYMNVYGDMFIGAKPNPTTGESSTYIKYVQEDEETGEPRLKIKAEVEFIHSDGQGGTESTTMDDFIDAIKHSIEDIQDQIDGSIDTWYYEGVPTLLNLPASEWNTDELKREHIGDLYYDKESGNAYRFIYDTTVEPNEYKWIQLHDDAISEALRLAAEAKDTADNKRRVFLTQPTPPYDQGDLWVNAVWPTSGEHQGETYNNEILKCVTAKTDQQTFSISDWSVANGYTAALNNFLTNTYAPFISNIQGQVDQKAETWYQDSNPATAWYDATQTPVYDVRAQHVGDIWMDTSANGHKQTKIYQYITSRADYDWLPQAVPDEVFDYADGKCAIYVNNPTNTQNPYPTNYHEKDMWILPIDGTHDTYTIGGVEFKAGEVLFSSADSTSFDAAHWSKKLRYTGDERIDGFINQILNGTGASGDDATVANAISSIKGALNEGTLIDGGLVLTSVLGLRSNSRVWAGISGMYNTSETGTGYKGHGIAAWYGGGMSDWEVYLDTLTQEQRQSATITDAYAKSLFRFDGSGYLASGNITWDAQGRVAIKDITTLVGGNNTDILNALTTFNNAFHFTTAQGSSTILNINPQYAFSHLEIYDVNGNHAVATTDYVNENFVTKAFFNRLFQAYSSTTTTDANKVSPNEATAINNLKILVGAWTDQYLSAKGINPQQSGGGSTFDEGQMWTALGQNSGTYANSQIHAGHLTTALSGYVKGVKYNNGAVISPNASGIVDLGTIIVTGDYLPMSGGVMTGDITLPVTGSLNWLYSGAGGIAASILREDNVYTDYTKADMLFDAGSWTSSNITAFNFKTNGSNFALCIKNDGKIGIGTNTPAQKLDVDGDVKATNFRGALIGNADTATKLSNSVNINGTAFDGSASITTATWGESRNITIKDADSTNVGNEVSVNGSAAVTLLLPSTIKATLTGNATTATSLQTSRSLWGQPFNGTGDVSGDITLGVGVTDVKLGVSWSASNSDKYNYISFSNYNLDGGIVYFSTNGTSASSAIGHRFKTNGSDCALTILNSANVGIGTTSPLFKLDVNGDMMVTQRLYLYKHDTDSSKDVYIEYVSSGVNKGVHLAGDGFYSDSFVSALGVNSQSGGGGVSSLSELIDVQLTSLANGNLLKYNGSKWTNVTLNSLLSGYATESWVQLQGYLTSHQTLYSLKIQGGSNDVTTYTPNSGAVTFKFVAGTNITLDTATANQITINNGYSYIHPTGGADTTIEAADKKVLSAITVNNLGHVKSVSSKTLEEADIPDLSWSKITTGKPNSWWGVNTIDSNGAVKGAMTSVDSITATTYGTGNVKGFNDLDLWGRGGASASNNGGHVDFHYNGAQNYTGRIIEDGNGIISILNDVKTTRLYLYKDATDSSNDVYLVYNNDSSNPGVHVVGGGLYADTYISALGSNSQGGGSVIDLTSVSSNILPSETSTYGIGSSQKKWKDGYFSGYVNAASITANSVTCTGGVSVTGGIAAQSMSTSSGYSVSGKDNTYVLLAGGGTMLLSEIVGDSYLPLSGGVMTGDLTFSVAGAIKWLYGSGDTVASSISRQSNTFTDYTKAEMLFDAGSWTSSNITAFNFKTKDANFSLCVKNNGNIGIGTNSPSYKLSVSGDVQATNFRGALIGNADTATSATTAARATTADTATTATSATTATTATTAASCSGNAATATSLQNERKIWGQSFNGTADISGDLTFSVAGAIKWLYGSGDTVASSISRQSNTFTDYTKAEMLFDAGSWTSSNITAFNFKTKDANFSLCVKNNGNVGVGTNEPAQKLDVNGNVKAMRFYLTDQLYFEVDGTSIKCNGNFYATGAVSALGANSQSGGGGVGDVTWELLASAATNNRTIHSSYIADTLANYATQSWVTSQGYLTSSALSSYVTMNTAQNITAKKTFTVQQAFTVASGSPFTVESSTVVTNLNADKLDGQDGSYYATATGLSTANTNISTLQGFFTGGVAKSAAQLSDTSEYTAWGQTFFNSGLPTSISNAPLSGVTNIDSLLYFNTTNTQTKFASNNTLVQFTRGNWTFTPKLYVDGHAGFNGEIYANGLDLVGSNASGNVHGGYIDFHYNASTADFTTRIIESTNGVLSIMKSSGATGLVVGTSTTNDYIKIGGATLTWDGSALKVDTGFYSESFVSALGSSSGGGGGVGDVTWALLADSTDTRQIAKSHLTSVLAGYLEINNGDISVYSLDAINALVEEGAKIGYLCFECDQYGRYSNGDYIHEINDFSATLNLNYQSSYGITMCYGNGNGGNVSIGYSAPNSSYKLCVNGNTYLHGVLSVKDFFIQNSGPNYYNIGGNGLTVYQNGTWTGGSDIRRKDVVTNIGCDINQIASAPIFDFIWKADITRTVHVGTSAQYWSKVFENAVSEGGDGYLYMDYGATALASVVITARKVLDHEGRIRLLEIENQALRKEIEQLKKAA